MSVWITIFLIGLSIHQCSAIWCYACSSIKEEGCGDEFRISTSDSKFRSQCDGSCLKRRGTRVDGAVRRVEIVRSCRVRTSEKCYSETFNGLDMNSCTCNVDFCNGSHYSVQEDKVMLLSTSILSVLYFIYI